MKSGIYTITNLVNGKLYVGYAINFNQRKGTHWRDMRNGNHKNPHLRNAVKEYGIENFKFEILEEWSEEYLVGMEHYWCLLLNAHNREYGYNTRPTHPYGESRWSEESRKRLSIAASRRKHTEVSKQKMRERRLGYKQSPEIIEKRAAQRRGVKQNSEWVKKRAIAMSAAKKGKDYSGQGGKIVIQYDLNGNIIREWSYMTLINRELGYSVSTISSCCTGNRRRKNGDKSEYRGYIWKFKN